MSTSKESCVVGIDVSKSSASVCFLAENESVVKQFERKVERYNDLVKDLKKQNAKLVVLEATGGYEKNLALRLHQAGVPFRVVDPLRVRQFASSIGQYAKTDKVDAHVIALYGLRNKIEPKAMPSEETVVLKELVHRREQLVKMRAEEQNRKGKTRNKKIEKNIKEVIKYLKNEIDDIDKDIDDMISSDEELEAKKEVLTSVKGVGEQTARVLISSMPELGRMNRREAASMAGVAPYPRDSGKRNGVRRIRGGRPEIRNALYMAVMTGIRHNPVIKEFYERLKAKGKKTKQAMTACMRKLVVILNATMKVKHYSVR